MASEHVSHEGIGQKSPLSSVPSDSEKKRLYETALQEIKERVKDVDSFVSRMATVVAVLRNNMPHYFWCGFYFAEEGEMVVGPYQGSTACPNIAYSGVCGTSAEKKDSIIVPDVHKFEGHITCDVRSNSEIVVPLIGNNGMVIAVLDVDSTELDAFNEVDRDFLDQYIMPLLLEKEE